MNPWPDYQITYWTFFLEVIQLNKSETDPLHPSQTCYFSYIPFLGDWPRHPLRNTCQNARSHLDSTRSPFSWTVPWPKHHLLAVSHGLPLPTAMASVHSPGTPCHALVVVFQLTVLRLHCWESTFSFHPFFFFIGSIDFWIRTSQKCYISNIHLSVENNKQVFSDR